MKEISLSELDMNVFSALNDDWMLITARKNDQSINTMTASWGFFGVMWGRPVFCCVIRPQRYTYEFVEEAERVTLSFYGEEYRDALKICGSKSGRDCDKIALAGLKPECDGEAVYFNGAKTVFLGKKLYYGDIDKDGFIAKALIPRYYPDEDFHRAYVCEIEKIFVED